MNHVDLGEDNISPRDIKSGSGVPFEGLVLYGAAVSDEKVKINNQTRTRLC